MIYDDRLHYSLIPFLADGFKIKSFLEVGCHQGRLLSKMVALNIPIVIGLDYAFKADVPGAQTYMCNSDEFFTGPVREFEPFDMIFIDCDHAENAVERDFNYAIKYVADNGLVMLHDTLPIDRDHTRPDICNTAYKFAARLRSNDEYESCTLPFSPGLTIVRKRRSQVPWESDNA